MDSPHLTPFLFIALLILLYEFEEQVQFPATIRLLENSICQRYYAASGHVDLPVDEALCKIGPIQRHLATVRGWYSALGTFPSQYRFRLFPSLCLCLLMLPSKVLVLGPAFGRLADSIGRRPVLGLVTPGMVICLAWIYIVCTKLCATKRIHRSALLKSAADARKGALWAMMPTEWVWLTVLFRIIGGGPFMAITLHATMVADLCDGYTRFAVLLLFLLRPIPCGTV